MDIERRPDCVRLLPKSFLKPGWRADTAEGAYQYPSINTTPYLHAPSISAHPRSLYILMVADNNVTGILISRLEVACSLEGCHALLHPVLMPDISSPSDRE